ncbi:MAG: thermonuclease family protein [Myxococcota bacterium]|nr:thermonuclease family protein [Myxococcota bacterium]
MSRISLTVALVSVLSACAATPSTQEYGPVAKRVAGEPAAILLNGDRMDVRWSDGDSFKFLDGPYRGNGVRLSGFNTLESYGPVHRWGSWSAAELYAIASSSKDVAGASVWHCSTEGERDGYGRLLVDCPGASEALIRAGHAHVLSMDGPGPERLLRVQARAQRQKKGIWRKGVPQPLVTSTHSADEGSGYNRLIDTVTGESSVRNHDENYEICHEVCEGPSGEGSCLTYVPYSRRYRDKPDCLR